MARTTLAPALTLSLLLVPGAACAAAEPERPPFREAAARELLRELAPAGRPHPIGSAAQRELRARLVERLRGLGYEPRVQRAFVCSDFRRSCGTVENVLARLPGRSPGVVLVNSHYDTQPGTPGAGDPMAGVAVVLELARLLRDEPPGRNGVVFLLNDGEEAGLLGSTAFVRGHPWAREVRAVVNLDARGSRGHGLAGVFVGGSSPILGAWARSGAPVRGTSLLPALIGLLPNTNDLAVFDELRVPGVLVGFVEGIRSYHSARDTVEHLAPESLRTQGEIALGLVRELAAEDLSDRERGDAVFFAAGPWLVRWPAAWAPALACGAATLLLVALLRPARGRRPSPTEGLWGAAALVLSTFAGAVGALAAEKVRQAVVPVPSDRVAYPVPSVVAVFAAAAAAGWIATSLLRSRSGGGRGHAVATALALAAAGIAVAWKAPGASFLFLIPVAAAAGGAWWGPRAMAAAGAVASALLWIPALWSFHPVFGLAAPTPLGGVLGLLLGWLAPWSPPPRWRWAPAAAAAAVSAAGLAVAARLPTFTAAQPQALTLAHVTLHAPSSRPARSWWLANGWPLPPAFLRVAAFDLDEDPMPWSRIDTGSVAVAPHSAAPAPLLAEVERSPVGPGLRRVRALVRSPRGALVLHLVVPEGPRLRGVLVDGVAVPPDSLVRYSVHREGYEVLTFWAPPERGHRLELVVEGNEPLAAELVDRSPGAPEAAGALLRGRPVESAPWGFGDSVVVRRPVAL